MLKKIAGLFALVKPFLVREPNTIGAAQHMRPIIVGTLDGICGKMRWRL